MSQLHIDRVLETGVYVDALDRVKAFYIALFQFPILMDTPRLVAFDVGGNSVLILFQRGECAHPTDVQGGFIPGHGASGVQNYAFAIAPEQVDPWLERLAEKGIAVESRVFWEGGSQSIYFRDPEGHSLELATPGLWK